MDQWYRLNWSFSRAYRLDKEHQKHLQDKSTAEKIFPSLSWTSLEKETKCFSQTGDASSEWRNRWVFGTLLSHGRKCPRSARSEGGISTSWQKCCLNNSVQRTRSTNQQELLPAGCSVWWAQGSRRLWPITWVMLMATAWGNLSKHVDITTTEHRNKEITNHQLVMPVLPWSICHSEPLIEHKVKKNHRKQIPNTLQNG